MKVAVFHPGTQHSWQTAEALQDLGRLQFYATSIFYRPDAWPYRAERLLPAPLARRLRAEFRRFEHPPLDPALVRTLGWAEWAERVAARLGAGALAGWFDRVGNRHFHRLLAGEIASGAPFALWGYNSSAREAFELGKAHHRRCILDRTNGDFRSFNRLMEREAAAYPRYFLPEQRGMPDWLVARDEEEYRLADHILVGSPFAAETIRRESPGQASKVEVLEYGYDSHLFGALPQPQPVSRGEPVRFLFLGQLVPRKGIHLVLEAFRGFAPAEARLTLVGQMGIPAAVFADHADRVDYRPTVARVDVPAIMAAHHVFLLPTLFEGAGIALYEAQAAGMAIIQGRNAAEVATPATGIMLDPPTTDSLAAAMRALVDDREQLNAMRGAAHAAAPRWSGEGYRDRIAAFLARAGLSA